jgi:hypothetical protein
VVATKDSRQRVATFEAAVFLGIGNLWTRKDVKLLQTWYPPDDVRAVLENVGFVDVRITARDGAKLADSSVDKAYFACTRP